MKGLVGIAVVLGLVGTVLGIMSLSGDDAFDEHTLSLTGGEEERIPFTVEHIDKSHPLGNEGWTTHREVTGDATGEWVIMCVPLAGDKVECNGSALLEDGDIEIEGTESAEDDGQATSAIVGGTGAYEGAVGEVDVDFENDEYTLHFHTPKE